MKKTMKLILVAMLLFSITSCTKKVNESSVEKNSNENTSTTSSSENEEKGSSSEEKSVPVSDLDITNRSLIGFDAEILEYSGDEYKIIFTKSRTSQDTDSEMMSTIIGKVYNGMHLRDNPTSKSILVEFFDLDKNLIASNESALGTDTWWKVEILSSKEESSEE